MGSRTASVWRIPNVPAGYGVYAFTLTAASGSMSLILDYWQWEPDEAHAPLVVLVKQPYPLDYTAYGGTPPTDAGVDALNAVTEAVSAEFDGRVITVDTHAISGDTTCWVPGNVHPTGKGHRIIAELVADAVAATGLRVA